MEVTIAGAVVLCALIAWDAWRRTLANRKPPETGEGVERRVKALEVEVAAMRQRRRL